MYKDAALLMARYNQKTNQELIRLFGGLSEEQWNRQMGGYYQSIRDLCNHIYIADHNWLCRFATLGDFAALRGKEFTAVHPFADQIFQSLGDFQAKRERLDQILLDFVQEIEDSVLAGPLNFKTMKGEAQSRNAGGCLVHVFNHQTHHRGMISVYLDMLGISNDYSNLMTMV